MLAGHGAAHGDAGLQNVGAKEFAAVQLVGVVGVKQNQGVQIAVACVEHIEAAQLVFFFHLGNGLQDVGQTLARNGAVHAHVVGADAARSGKRIFAAAPELQALRFVAAHGDGGGAAVAQHLTHAADFFFDFFGRAVALAQQNGGGAEVVAGVYKVFNGSGHGAVHHLESGRDDAGGNHRSHRVAGFAQLVKAGHDAARQLRLGHQLDGDFGGHGQHAFAADDDAEQVVARCVQRVAAELDLVALDGEAAHLEHVVHCQAVLEAVHAARVFGHVAAYGAGDLARRIRRVIQAQRCGRLRNSQVAHPALHHGRAAGGVHF